MDIVNQNRIAWDQKVEDGAVYTQEVTTELIKKSKAGDWGITVKTKKPVPKSWFPPSLKGKKILCLASGGGQQGPILAAAGGDVTVFDISERQLEKDKLVARCEGLQLKTVQGDMTNLSCFKNGAFDIIIHPVSNLFVEDISLVWQEAYRVLKDKGTLISGFTNPVLFIFDDAEDQKGNLVVKHEIPFHSLQHLTQAEAEAYIEAKHTIEFGHTLEDQIQGQIEAGFSITGFYEDDFGGSRPLDQYLKCFIATKAVKISL
ncbi:MULTISPECIES: class I SAM-dependent methyltransferase [unclassified Virgibacillus]|uniref:class I SAM-dependent methyltransferase n=1 Tax=unclassified Virgibacillus TaxID=2620237 RepID=UPI00090A8F62|nr:MULTISPECIES: class I SAM-dependent methyltransferase [unclassified Virgibacillus]API92618.1 SAM-dependent methyltransferase [Virgibacillus sp. 6R]MBS7428109.1 class I SAM-dependent methyltransferase [Virgibacillus sp. 19R1-5]